MKNFIFCAASFIFYSYWKNRFASYTRRLLYKRIVLKSYVKNHLKMNHMELLMHVEKDYLCFYENSTNQTLTFISNKVVYLKKHLAYKV